MEVIAVTCHPQGSEFTGFVKKNMLIVRYVKTESGSMCPVSHVVVRHFCQRSSSRPF